MRNQASKLATRRGFEPPIGPAGFTETDSNLRDAREIGIQNLLRRPYDPVPNSERECDCQPRQLRCVHLGDLRLVLGYLDSPHHYQWSVDILVGPPSIACPVWCCDLIGWPSVLDNRNFYHGFDPDEALAAFRAAEAELLAAVAS